MSIAVNRGWEIWCTLNGSKVAIYHFLTYYFRFLDTSLKCVDKELEAYSYHSRSWEISLEFWVRTHNLHLFVISMTLEFPGLIFASMGINYIILDFFFFISCYSKWELLVWEEQKNDEPAFPMRFEVRTRGIPFVGLYTATQKYPSDKDVLNCV